VELLEGDRARAGGAAAGAGAASACLTVWQVAARYGVSRSWVYAHQRELGAMRLGQGHGRDFGSMRQWWPRRSPRSIDPRDR
jgi:hypothetical protein